MISNTFRIDWNNDDDDDDDVDDQSALLLLLLLLRSACCVEMDVGTKLSNETNLVIIGNDSISIKKESLKNKNLSQTPYHSRVPVRIPDKCPKKERLGIINCNINNSAHG